MDIKKLLDLINDELTYDNINTEIVEDRIVWKDNSGDENHVDAEYADYFSHKFAWWQFHSNTIDVVRIYNGNFILNWRVPINYIGISYGCIFLKFYGDLLFVAFTDKHNDRLFSLDTKTLEVSELYYYQEMGVSITRGWLYVKDYAKDEIFCIDLGVRFIDKKIVSEETAQLMGAVFKTRW